MEQARRIHDYRAIHRTALQVNWRVEDIVGGDRALDFGLPFLPEVWVEADALGFLGEAEKLALNHVRAHSYLYFLRFAAEPFLPFIPAYLSSRIHTGGQAEIHALLHLAEA